MSVIYIKKDWGYLVYNWNTHAAIAISGKKGIVGAFISVLGWGSCQEFIKKWREVTDECI